MNTNIRKTVFTALFAALVCIATMIIKVPTVGTNGYVNIGDAIVLISAWILGNPFGAIAAGLGSGMADILSGYAAYAPGTTIIKFGMAFIACIVYRGFDKVKIPRPVSFVLSGILAELVMIAGYLIYEATLLGYGSAALASVPSNAIQGITCLVLGVALGLALKKIPYVSTVGGE